MSVAVEGGTGLWLFGGTACLDLPLQHGKKNKKKLCAHLLLNWL